MARVLFLLISTHPARTRQEELRLRVHLHITEVEQLRSVHKEDASARGSEQWERQINGDGMAESWLRELEGQQGAGRGAPCTDHSSKPLQTSLHPKKNLDQSLGTCSQGQCQELPKRTHPQLLQSSFSSSF